MKIEENVLPTTKKEAIKMIKKCLAITLTALIVMFNVLPAQAYTQLQTPVSVTASGTITGVTIAFAAGLVNQNGSIPAPTSISFTNPSGVANSGEAIAIRGGSNVVGGRVIIYTDNASYWPTQDKDPRVKLEGGVYKPTGVDGAGLVGEAEKGYVASLIWGVSLTPNTNAAYTFDGDLNDRIGEVYVVDKGHTYSFVGTGTPTDTQTLYRKDGTAVANTANGAIDPTTGLPTPLYPQYFGTVAPQPTTDANNWDLYDKIATDTSRVVVSQQLSKNITTIAHSISLGSGADAGYYICSVPKLTTAASDDSITARIGKADGTAGTELYVNIGGNFTGLPAQTYSTTKLYVAIVQD